MPCFICHMKHGIWHMKRFAQYALWLASFLCLAALCVTLLSPSRTPGEKSSSLYNLPLYSVFFSWLYYRLRESAKVSVATIILDLAVVGLAASRFLGPIIPSSGHALFLGYSLLTTGSRFYRIVAAILLALTIALKLSWGDYSSWLYGILIGLLFAGVYRVIASQTNMRG